VKRELFEEAGIQGFVRRLLPANPWPFPSSIDDRLQPASTGRSDADSRRREIEEAALGFARTRFKAAMDGDAGSAVRCPAGFCDAIIAQTLVDERPEYDRLGSN